MRNVFLVVDKGREEKVIGFIERAFHDIHYIEEQINTGDYLICEEVPGGPAKILACIERKSHVDFAASISDGRYANRGKMVELRQATGAQLYWLMEGPAFCPPGRRFGKKGSAKPYSTLHTAELHLMARDGIFVLRTPNEPGTAQELYELCVAFRDLPLLYTGAAHDTGAAHGGADEPASSADEPASGTPASSAPASSAPASSMLALKAPDIVKGRIEQPDAMLAVQLWAALRGISVVTGEKFIREFSVRELLGGRPSYAEIGELKSPTGRTITKEGKASLRALQRGDPERALKVVAAIPGLSKVSAQQILEGAGGLRNLSQMEEGALAELKLAQKSREVRLGKEKAKKILFFLSYCERDARNSSQPSAQRILDADLDELLGAVCDLP